MLKLGGVAALGVAQRGVGIHDSQVTQVLQRHQVLGLPEAVQPAPAEGQRAEVLVHHVEQVLGPRESAGGVRGGGGGNEVNPGSNCQIVVNYEKVSLPNTFSVWQ